MRNSMRRPWAVVRGLLASEIGVAEIVLVGVIAAGIFGCTSSSMGGHGGGTPQVTRRSYHGSAPVGDFLNITVTPTSATGYNYFYGVGLNRV